MVHAIQISVHHFDLQHTATHSRSNTLVHAIPFHPNTTFNTHQHAHCKTQTKQHKGSCNTGRVFPLLHDLPQHTHTNAHTACNTPLVIHFAASNLVFRGRRGSTRPSNSMHCRRHHCKPLRNDPRPYGGLWLLSEVCVEKRNYNNEMLLNKYS